VAVFALGVLVLRGRGNGTVAGTFEAIGIKTSITVTRHQREEVLSHLKQAAQTTGRTAGLPEVERRLEDTQTVTRAAVLWIDDNPDNNVEENLMLRDLGLSVTQTLSSDGARRYLARARFDLVITDVGRRGDPEAGFRDIAELKASEKGRPVIVYTFDAGDRAELARSRGAEAVAETPADLLAAVLEHVAA
jgi:CheY-like chemotaxis protein